MLWYPVILGAELYRLPSDHLRCLPFQATEAGGETGGGGTGDAESAAPAPAPAAGAAPATTTAGGATAAAPKEQPKRLHISNIPFRFRDPDLRAMFGVSWAGRAEVCEGSERFVRSLRGM